MKITPFVNIFLFKAKQIITFKCGDCIKMPLKRKKNQVFVEPDVALAVVPQEVQNGLKLAPMTGLLNVKDNVHNILRCDDSMEELRNVPKALLNNLFKRKITYEYGTLDIEMFLKKLKQDGITDYKVTQTSEQDGILTKIVLAAEETEINITDKGSHIICNGKQSWRLKIRDLLTSCVNKF